MTGAERGRLLALIAAVTLLWGLNWPAMKFVVGELPPWTFRVVCVVVAGLTLLGLARLSGERVTFDRRLLGPMLLVSLFGVTGWHMLTAYGLMHVGGGRAAIVAYTMPVWSAVLGALFLNERLRWHALAALGLGMAGMAALIGPDLGRLGASPLGTVLILLAAFCWAAGTVGTKAWSWGIGTMALAGWQLVLGGIPIVVVWLFLEFPGDFSHMSLAGVLALLYVVFVALVFCFTSFLRIVRLLPAGVASISMLAIPVVGVVSSAWLLGEPIGLNEALALLLVLAALSLVLLPGRTRRPA